ncbi:dynein heavy chain domain-containing protein 1-like [Ascaphus truei]|uniref:dynein heavy chain domain-containing protein 1-like n=1 Tax=Ascaphus truei TaxID=8439 RepID=UPI003F5AAAF0
MTAAHTGPRYTVGGLSAAFSGQSVAGCWSRGRRLCQQLAASGHASPHDVELLAEEIVRFVSGAAHGSVPGWWLELLEVLNLLHPFRDLLACQRGVLLPALLRLHCVYERRRVQLSDLDVPGALRAAFLPDCSTLFYLSRDGKDPSKPGLSPLNLRELPHCVGDVGAKLAGAESVWRCSRGGTALALRTDLPLELLPDLTHKPYRSVSALPLSPRPPCAERAAWDGAELTGLSAAELLVTYRHLGRFLFLYMNRAEGWHCCPYDLVVTRPSLLRPEHFVFSPFGVLHVHPQDGSETLTLGAWHREAVLCRALRGIPYFRDFLRRRVFSRWKKHVKRIRFLRTQLSLSQRLILTVPHYTAALQHIYSIYTGV